MKRILKNKFIPSIIAILILANIATLIFYWLGHAKMERNNSPREILARELNFSDYQRQQYFDLAKEHNEKAERIRKEIKIKKILLYDLLKSDTINDSDRDNAALKVSLEMQSLDILTFEHFKKVRVLCNAEQKLKFDDLVQEIINKVNNPAQARRPPIQ